MNENINQPNNSEVERDYQAIPRDGPSAADNKPEQGEGERAEVPRIYVASLSDYNAGRLHGRWIDVDQSTEDVQEQIDDILRSSREPGAEEWAIHDYDGFGPVQLSEYESLETVVKLASGIAEHGEAFAHWADLLDRADWDDELDRFEETFQGTWSSMDEYAEQLLDDLGIGLDNLGPETLQPYISFDVEAFARDLSMDYRISEGKGGVYVFDY